MRGERGKKSKTYTPCLVKVFRLCLSTSIFPLCWKFTYVQLVIKNVNRFNPSSYRPIALLSCLSKTFEGILNIKVLKHLSSSNLISNRQYRFRRGRSTGDFLAFLTDSWSSFPSCFGETFAVALEYRKPSIESGTNLYFLNYPPTDSILFIHFYLMPQSCFLFM